MGSSNHDKLCDDCNDMLPLEGHYWLIQCLRKGIVGRHNEQLYIILVQLLSLLINYPVLPYQVAWLKRHSSHLVHGPVSGSIVGAKH